MQDQGIMGLQQAGAPPQAPDDQGMQAFEQARKSVSPEQLDESLSSSLMEQDPQLAEMLQQRLAGIDLTAEEISVLREIIDELIRNPDQYAELRAAAIEQGIPAEMLPEQFDGAYLGALRVAISMIKPSASTDQGPMPEEGMPGMEGMPPEPQGFKDGGPVSMKPVAQYLASMGRNGDSMLAHVTPAEVAVLKRMGGSGTINPQTGMPEFFVKWLSKKLSKLGNNIGDAVQDVLKTPIGRTIATIAIGFVAGPAVASYIGVGGATATAVSSMVGSLGTSLLAGDDLKSAITSAAVSGITAGAADWAAGAPVSGPVKEATVMGQINKIGDFVRSGTDAIGLTTPDPLKSLEKIDYAGNDPLGFDKYEGPGTAQEQTLRAVGIDPTKATAEEVSKRLGIPLDQASAMLPKSSVASSAASSSGGIRDILKDPFSKNNITKTIIGGTGLAYLAGAFNPEKTSPADLGMNVPGGPTYKSGRDLLKEKPDEYGVKLGDVTAKTYSPSIQYTTPASVTNYFAKDRSGDTMRGGAAVDYSRPADPYDYTDPRNNPFLAPLIGPDFSDVPGFAAGGSVKNTNSTAWSKSGNISSRPTSASSSPNARSNAVAAAAKAAQVAQAAKDRQAQRETAARAQAVAQATASAKAAQAAGKTVGQLHYDPRIQAQIEANLEYDPAQLKVEQTAASQAAEVKRQQIAAAQAAEAERQRLAAEEAERQRLAAEEAERQRIAAEQAEAERQRLAAAQAAEAERQRLAAEEAERQRIAAEEAERRRVAASTIFGGANVVTQPTKAPEAAGIGTLPASSSVAPAVMPKTSATPVNLPTVAAPSTPTVAPVSPPAAVTPSTPAPTFSWGATNPFAPAQAAAAPTTTATAAAPAQSPFGVFNTVPNAANIASYGFKRGGIADLGNGKFPRKTGPINGPGTGTSDSIPAMLSDGEFVFTAKAVRNAGGGSRREGARRMYALMKALEKQAHG